MKSPIALTWNKFRLWSDFVNPDKNIREDFLGFITVERITGESLATVLFSWLESRNIDVAFCRGQQGLFQHIASGGAIGSVGN